MSIADCKKIRGRPRVSDEWNRLFLRPVVTHPLVTRRPSAALSAAHPLIVRPIVCCSAADCPLIARRVVCRLPAARPLIVCRPTAVSPVASIMVKERAAEDRADCSFSC